MVREADPWPTYWTRSGYGLRRVDSLCALMSPGEMLLAVVELEVRNIVDIPELELVVVHRIRSLRRDAGS
jgi:hypothetical protein